MSTPLELINEVWLDAAKQQVDPTGPSPVVAVSEELRDAFLSYYDSLGMPTVYDPAYKSKTGLILAGKDCVVDPQLNGLAAYTRY